MIQLLLFLDLPWEQARGYLRDDLERLQAALNTRWAATFGDDNQLDSGTIAGDATPATRYVSNTGTDNAPTWDQVELSNGVSGRLPYANLTAATASARLLGRGSSGAGDWEEVALGSGLTLNGSTLSALTIPGRRGEDGRDGQPGATGVAGPAGADGAPGPMGPPGRRGEDGRSWMSGSGSVTAAVASTLTMAQVACRVGHRL